MTQNFTVVETQTEKKGVQVPLKEVVADVRGILDGKIDPLQPEDVLYIGSLKDVEAKLKEVPKAKTTQQQDPQPAAPGAPPTAQSPTQTTAQQTVQPPAKNNQK
jgi:hypothetical protein